jgi:hypothetical protein
MAAHEFYLFRVRDPISGKWGQTRYKITDQTAHERYGEGNYEPIVHTRKSGLDTQKASLSISISTDLADR